MLEEKKKIAVVAIGGNSLIKDKNHKTIPDQYQAAKETSSHIVNMIESGWDVVIGHGNGPQVGFILRRSELSLHELHPVSLDFCGADTQGSIGYMFQQNLSNEFRKRGIKKIPVTVVTQVLVDKDDPAFKNPTKPIGSFMDENTSQKKVNEDKWVVREDSGRGWRRVVPSPPPIEIIERNAVKELISKGFVVISVGGGGIPVIRNKKGNLEGVAAVIDKDFASSLLATEIQADLFLISTAVEKVYLNFGKPNQTPLETVTITELKRYLEEDHFAPGSMLPKIKAIIEFFENGGKKAIITDPENIARALKGETGTHILP
ncbi:MAG: carbamate kinase [Candidatus Hodarchaeales archaeon]|jgi:carbamate kinase